MQIRFGPNMLALALVACTLVGAAQSADDSRLQSYGRHLAQECTACHRIDGIDNGIPSITGRDPQEFASTLEFYRSGVRTNPVMVSVVQSLDRDQIQALASYFASLPKPIPKK